MNNVEVPLPDALYKELKRVARQRDWSLAELMRRASEQYITCYPKKRSPKTKWTLPEPVDLGGPPLISLEDFNAEAEAIEYKLTHKE